MATPVKLPELGESVTEGTVTRWLKSVGDDVAVDEPLLEVSTDKVDTEIPSPVAGTLLEIKVDEDETVDVGTELAVIGDSDEGGGGDSGSSDSSESSGGAGDAEDSEDSEDDSGSGSETGLEDEAEEREAEKEEGAEDAQS